MYDSVSIQASITTQATIGIADRQALTYHLVEALQMTRPYQQPMAAALLYTVAAQAAGAQRRRARSFIRLGLTSEARDADAVIAAVIAQTRGLLREQYALERATSAALGEALQIDAGGQPLAEIGYTRWRDPARWITPIHVQPILDHLMRQPGCAALQFTVERPAGAANLRLGVVALGEATTPVALRLLMEELCGCGTLSTRERPPSAAPSAAYLLAQSADERAHILRNLTGPAAEPWTRSAQPHLDVALTRRCASFMLPLPMQLL